MSKTKEWIGNWSDYTSELREIVSSLKSAGIETRLTYSRYEEHKTLQVAYRDLEKAQEVLRDIGESYIADYCFFRPVVEV